MEISSDKTRRRAKTHNPWSEGHGDQEWQEKQKIKDPQPVEVMEITSDKTRRRSKTHNPWRSWRSRVTRQEEDQRPTTRGGHGDQEWQEKQKIKDPQPVEVIEIKSDKTRRRSKTHNPWRSWKLSDTVLSLCRCRTLKKKGGYVKPFWQ